MLIFLYFIFTLKIKYVFLSVITELFDFNVFDVTNKFIMGSIYLK